MNKILAIRIIVLLLVGSTLASCGAGPAKRANTGEAPISARARNVLAAENPTGLLRIGESFEKSGNLKGALNIYGQAMAAAPELIAAQIAYARVIGALGANDRSIIMLVGLLETHPNNPAVRQALANSYIRAGQFKAAVIVLKPALEAPDVTEELLDLGGRIAQVSGDSKQARRFMGLALDKSPNNTVILRHMALSFALDADYATAVGLLQKAMDNPSGLISGKQSLAFVYALSGQFEAAMQLARGSMSQSDVNTHRFIYKHLPDWTKEQQAMAVLFNQFPKELFSRQE